MSARRTTYKLRALYASRRARSTSLADGPGYLYAGTTSVHARIGGGCPRYGLREDEELVTSYWKSNLSIGPNDIALIVGELTSKSSYFAVNGTGRGESSFDHCFCGLQYRVGALYLYSADNIRKGANNGLEGALGASVLLLLSSLPRVRKGPIPALLTMSSAASLVYYGNVIYKLGA
ncbi:hypothetical protein DFH05DRAFT_1542362 [Lentinula detonsa]|uniref:Uncharacterized protein n=1 Tax=Lentinula detonsa TaxID=2804962 RepID=A0A9W8P261_9AGAR|nr:hypothetical protein DFH05DRAFT_1542362 [Lentinula detonsa]